MFALNWNLFGASSQTGDFVTTFGGNDELHDGNRRDTLEGGADDDRYILMADNAADIIIVGEGDDILSGGGAEDRIVLRIDVLDQMYEDWVESQLWTSYTDLERLKRFNIFVAFHENAKVPSM